MANYDDHRDAGHILFGLHSVENDQCTCENPECTALFKHPRISNWQHTPFYSDEQFEVMCDIGHLATGYGVLVKDIFVVDVDARNGGLDSYNRLCADLQLDLEDASGYVVETGSGGGSMHIYFNAPIPPKALMQTIGEYPGIDFKSSGFVVGAGSLHKSGNHYEVKDGYPQDLTDMPQCLIDLLEKKTQYRSTDLNGETVDIEVEELQNIVGYIQQSDQYQRWVDVGMAIHDTTQGSMQGLAIWDSWSQQAENYETGQTATKWSGFGKGTSLVSLGTLMHYAKENGYVQPVTFNADVYVKNDEPIVTTLDERVAHIDIRKPPKFAGVLCDWVNAQCRYPRENLAAAASLYILSCIGGMRHKDARDDLSLNFIAFNVAGSGTGKDAIDKAIKECFDVADITQASYGTWKSTQEAVRNLIEHQASFYNIDELGEKLSVVSNAKKRGGAVYLEELIGFFMSAYTKYDSTLSISGDLKRELKDGLMKEWQRINAKMDKDGETEDLLAQQEAILKKVKEAEKGIVNPYLSVFGLTAPHVFESLVDRDMATNGFIARATIFREHETNPRIKKGFKNQVMPVNMRLALAELYSGGEHSNDSRVQRMGNKQAISTTDEASEMLDEIYEYFYEMAEQHKSRTGMEAIPRRGWEICSKISLITAMPSRTRTIEDVMYAFAVAKLDIQRKIELAYGNEASQHKDTRADALMVKIKSMLDKDSETTVGQIRNRLREFQKDDIDKALSLMVERGIVLAVENQHKVNKTITIRYKLA